MNTYTYNVVQLNQGMQINFIGRRLKTKDDVKLRLFEAEIPVKIITVKMHNHLHASIALT